jgi:hypothetical protein
MATIKSFKQLRAAGGIVSKEPVKRHIEWKGVDPLTGEEIEYDADVHIVKQGAGAVLDIYADQTKEHISAMLSQSVMLEDDKGKLALISFDDAYKLDIPLRNALWTEVQVMGGVVRKNSPPSTNSSASSSPAESAAAQ